jgi:hypothetical protein
MPANEHSIDRFSRPNNQTTTVVAFLLFGLLGFVGLVVPASPSTSHSVGGNTGERVFSGIVLVACLFLAYRGRRSATILVNSSGVVVRTLLRTRRFDWSVIAEFTTRDQPVGIWTRTVLIMKFTSGRRLKVTEFNGSPSAPSGSNEVAATAEDLNGYLDKSRRTATGMLDAGS